MMASWDLGGLSVKLCRAIATLEIIHARLRRLKVPAGDEKLLLSPVSDDITTLIDNRLVPSARRLCEGIEQYDRLVGELLELLPYIGKLPEPGAVQAQIGNVLGAGLNTAQSQSDLSRSNAGTVNQYAARLRGTCAGEMEGALTNIAEICCEMDAAWIRKSAALKAAAPEPDWPGTDVSAVTGALAGLRQVCQSDARLARSAFNWLLRLDPIVLSERASAGASG